VNCTICGTLLDPALEKSTTHPGCFPFAELDEGDPFVIQIKTLLTDVILWAEKQHPRRAQAPIGPSELGSACDRRIGYRVAGVSPCNTDFDPWPMIMGTAIHSWLDDAFTNWNRQNKESWMTETALHLDDYVRGHADLYNRELETVIDWKGVGTDVMRKIKRDGVPVGYQIQTHLYGYGFTLKGLPVKKVCLAFLPRSGWLKDMYVWCDDYNQDVAVGCIHRLYGIADRILQLKVTTNPHRWEQVDNVPSNDCGWCPWYNPGLDAELGASDKGCPGR
jgi:hypothetical protein